MKYISHRGNINGKFPEKENTVEYIIKALELGYDVEIDIRYNDGWYLGHDEPIEKIDLNTFSVYKDKIWFHCKNAPSLQKMNEMGVFNYFWHQNDSYTITSNGYFWTFPGMDIIENSIICMPELGVYTSKQIYNSKGICSDYIERYSNLKICF